MFTLIETSEDLMFLNKELLEAPFVAVDTEFRRTGKEDIKLALMQINDSDEIYLIDCLNIYEPKDICTFLSSPKVTKIFHSHREDLEAIFSWTQLKVSNIFDTQIANSFLDGSFSISYQDLVQLNLGLLVNKDATRTNWLKRPLSESQLNYAAFDVYYLIDLYKFQIEELIKSKKIDWLNEEVNRTSKSDVSLDLPKHRIFSITKQEEKKILQEFNSIVEEISLTQEINPTLLFSKQNQKNLLHTTLNIGLEETFKSITSWRRSLVKDPISRLFQSFGVS